MSFEVSRDEGGVLLTFRGTLAAADVIAGFEGLAAAGLGDASAVTIDFSAVDHMALSVEDHHAISRRLRVLFAKGAEFRVALVATSPAIHAQLADYVDVRNMMTGRAVAALPEVRHVDSVAEARAWLGPGD